MPLWAIVALVLCAVVGLGSFSLFLAGLADYDEKTRVRLR